MEKTTLESEEKQYNKFQWFLFVVFIPLLFLIVIISIVLTVAGVNVFEEGKKAGENLPIISGLFDEKEQKMPSIDRFEKKIGDLETEKRDSEAEIAKLEELIDSGDQTIQRTELEKQQLEKEIEELRAAQDENKRAFKDIIRTYETMSAKKSAPIIAQLEDDEAVKILSGIKADTLTSIMEQMKPEDAARLTMRLTINSRGDSSP
ncbi:hypothetical protein ELQ35_08920 [Peribacillus cavernae]|uniref:Magnesium transporter MgtE intracellular domain-containing protein n=1 Tax=Peribacillus cavernae TaxID=1674310 RepID=A0A3S0W951_9BACI|nr:MotE family protein [Peribacillus cavernae]MDQ0217073.1 flagellar motility protein MotE (MotC chaperone) [Peribacillus cavernae]RUQ30449.1 hypothetical protein ELQ35_08920 [Peribacillus cavernae]